jgi:hypothetical protein
MFVKLNHVQIVLDTLANEVGRGSFRQKHRPRLTIGWQRVGVLFTTEVLSPEGKTDEQRTTPLTVLTPHAHEAGWLLDRLYEAFRPLLDICIERDLYERLAEAALDYCGYVDPGDSTDINLLKIILSEAEDILQEMRDGEFPYVT